MSGANQESKNQSLEEIYAEFSANVEKLRADYYLKIDAILEEIKQDKIKKLKEEIKKL